MKRLSRQLLLMAAAVGVGLIVAGSAAHAHPLGNFSVNQYDGLAFTPHGLVVTAIVNTAEIPTQQDKRLADADGNGDLGDRERSTYAVMACRDLAAQFEVKLNGQRLAWSVNADGYALLPGANGLPTARLACTIAYDYEIDATMDVTVANHYRGDRVGWHEMTATGNGVHLIDSKLPRDSLSDQLRAYPSIDAPTKVVDVRSAALRVAPGSATAAPDPTVASTAQGPLTAATTWAERQFTSVAAGRLTAWMAVLSVLLALALGAGHAALPGHGKTALAAYIAGREGRPRDALVIGATVTATHTVGVLIVGILLTSTAIIGERLLAYLGVVSGLVIVAVGVSMLVAVIRRRSGSGHRHPHPHDHPHPHEREHNHDHQASAARRLGLASVGIAGGLVPSPSALVVLLAAIGLGRAWFGIVLVLAYGLGMACALVAAGLLVLALQRKIAPDRAGGHLGRLSSRLRRVAPVATGALVLVVGLGLALRSAADVIVN